MRKNNRLAERNVRIWIITAVVLISVIILTFTLWNSTHKTTQTKQTNISTLTGKVTLIRKSCSAKSIYKDEDTKAMSICDSGEGIRVGDKMIVTSSGGPEPSFHVNIDSIQLGDNVTVHYITNENGTRTLDCDTCSIQKDS